MGLFDTVYCEYPLPDARHQGLEFQTKDLECALVDYTITHDGRLVLQASRGEQGSEHDIEWPIHGDIRIYTSKDSTWIEYVVRFTHSRVEWIRPLDEVPPLPALPAWKLFLEPSESAELEADPLDSASPGALPTDAGDAALRDAEEALLLSLRQNRQDLEKLLTGCSDHWGYEDPVYRFYHQSFKVYWLQQQTLSIRDKLQALAPGLPLNPWFVQIIESGTGKAFQLEDNARWTEVTRPILEAFFHARFFVEMAVRYVDYVDLDAPPRPLPSGYAALLYLFGIR